MNDNQTTKTNNEEELEFEELKQELLKAREKFNKETQPIIEATERLYEKEEESEEQITAQQNAIVQEFYDSLNQALIKLVTRNK